MFSLKDKVAVITGAASGLGKATAERFAKAGAKVVIADIQDGSDVAKSTGGIYVKTDVSKESEVKALMESAAEKFGKIDIVINNAGTEGVAGMVTDIKEEDLDKGININLKGVLWGIKHAVPHMTGGGSIINTASYAGAFGTPTYGIYVITKASIIALTKTAALELAPMKIRVNAICPSTMDTPMAYVEGAEIELKVSTMLQAIERLGTPEEAAALFHFLAAEESAFITGQAIMLDGGLSAGPALGMVGVLYEKAAGESLDLNSLKK